MAHESSSFKKVSGALLLGLAAGTLVGVLTAPKKGKKTQADLAKWTKTLLSEISDIVDDFKGELDMEQYQKIVQNLVKKFEKKFKLSRDLVEDLKEQLMERFEDWK
ncbi:YtxH domain-containing protein [Candidatus Uhrbacteria bacterium]|nr:YtxH domain-containing protein [Candidatus Uhrbacteria bacterium]